jgi:histone H3/H4
MWHIFSEINLIAEQENRLSVLKEDICLYVNSSKCSQKGTD